MRQKCTGYDTRGTQQSHHVHECLCPRCARKGDVVIAAGGEAAVAEYERTIAEYERERERLMERMDEAAAGWRRCLDMAEETRAELEEARAEIAYLYSQMAGGDVAMDGDA